MTKNRNPPSRAEPPRKAPASECAYKCEDPFCSVGRDPGAPASAWKDGATSVTMRWWHVVVSNTGLCLGSSCLQNQEEDTLAWHALGFKHFFLPNLKFNLTP